MTSFSSSLADIRLSFCMIVKNEQRHLARCLASVQPYVDELIVVDTGSEDDTIEIARRFGCQVVSFPWCDDFAAARNFAIDQTTGDWLLTLDADEELVVESSDWRHQVILQPHILAYRIPLLDVHQPITPLATLRLHRNLPELRYSGRYHESLHYQGTFINSEQLAGLAGIQILHYGYEEALLLQKAQSRDIPLLERIRQSGEISLLLLLTLADAYLRLDDVEKAQGCLAEALERLKPHLFSGEPPLEKTRLAALLFAIASNCLEHQQDYETVLLICRRGLEWFPNYPPLLHLTGTLWREMGFPLGATAYFEKCLQLYREGTFHQHEPFDQAFMTLWPANDVGLLYLYLGEYGKAIAAFELALSFDPTYEMAQQGLQAARQLAEQ